MPGDMLVSLSSLSWTLSLSLSDSEISIEKQQNTVSMYTASSIKFAH